ncbi:hypothetical protein B0T17DRAFT_590338 [Bombardia bombarda]|uniref:NAD(P)-binding protein n=1 Tax=Bombardia bombarda TaxID=252184 RepID=A0AA39XBT4_9PEZI|nr:hypothetical protein B0T17DRAFT_590338 [Bombardia bombarda]
MVSLTTVRQSNAQIPTTLAPGLVALFTGATSGIAQTALSHLVKLAPSPRIYTVARPQTAPSHAAFLSTLRQANPSATLTLIPAEVSLISEIDRIAAAIRAAGETKIDILFLSAGAMAFEGRVDTAEGLETSMAVWYYASQRAVRLLLPLLNAAASPRVVTVLAGGKEAPLNEADLDLCEPGNWSFWNAARQAATMSTLALERVARENPRVSVVHWYPGPVKTPSLVKGEQFGIVLPWAMEVEESGERGLWVATSDRYKVEGCEGGW